MTTNPRNINALAIDELERVVGKSKLGWEDEDYVNIMPGIPSDPPGRHSYTIPEDDMKTLRGVGFWADGNNLVTSTVWLDLDKDSPQYGSVRKSTATDFIYGDVSNFAMKSDNYYAFDVNGTINTGSGIRKHCKIRIKVSMVPCLEAEFPSPKECCACANRGAISADVKVILHETTGPECETIWFPMASQATQAKASMWRMQAMLNRTSACFGAKEKCKKKAVTTAQAISDKSPFDKFIANAVEQIPDLGVGYYPKSDQVAKLAFMPIGHWPFIALAATALARSLFPPPYERMTAAGATLDFTYYPSKSMSEYAKLPYPGHPGC
jgi:hypothetical protein